MDKFNEVLYDLVETIFKGFLDRGGLLKNGDEEIDPDVLASPDGGLPAIMWLVHQFYSVDYGIPFPSLPLVANSRAMLGYSLGAIIPPPTSTEVYLMVSDFLKNETLPLSVVECNFDRVFAAFIDWASTNIPDAQLDEDVLLTENNPEEKM